MALDKSRLRIVQSLLSGDVFIAYMNKKDECLADWKVERTSDFQSAIFSSYFFNKVDRKTAKVGDKVVTTFGGKLDKFKLTIEKIK